MSEDNLDSFLLQNSEDVSSQNTVSNTQSFPQGNSLPNRPKLKKIKRPKIRPTMDIPQAPDKIMPAFQSTSVAQNVATNTDKAALSSSLSAGKQLSDNVDKITSEEMIANTSENIVSSSNNELSNVSSEEMQNTSLVRAKDAQYMVSNESGSDLSFSLDDFANDFEYDEDGEEEILQEDASYIKKNVLYIAAGICLFIGLFIGKAFFSSQTIENHGLEGIVANPDVPAGRPRCGLTDKSQACVFYLMNWERQELNGRDFYKLAAYFTGREEYMIETENLRYATVKIKPGDFAQLNIPALK